MPRMLPRLIVALLASALLACSAWAQRPGDPLPLPFELRVSFGAPSCDSCPPVICPGRPVPMRVSGEFPDGCYRDLSLRVLPLGSPLTVVQMDLCRAPVCTQTPEPYVLDTDLPPVATGEHTVTLRIVIRDCVDSTTVLQTFTREYTYRVGPDCGPTGECVWPFLRSPAPGECAAVIGPDSTASVDIAIETPFALGGAQGTLVVPNALRLLALEPIGAAAGMRLLWNQSADAVQWILFGKDGQTIAPAVLSTIMRAKLRAVRIEPGGSNLSGLIRVASDSLGDAAPICDVSTMRLVPVAIRVCAPERGCDVNHDGSADVRDLVTMVRCLRTPGACADSLGTPDCNGDGLFGLADVLCCARRILHPGRPDTLAPREAPEMRVQFGQPWRSGDRVDLPFALSGRAGLSEARLTLRYPADAYALDEAAFEGAADGWLVLHEEAAPGELQLAMIRTNPSADDVLPWRLALRLRAGAQPQGEVLVLGDDLRDADGAPLSTRVAGTASPRLAAAVTPAAGMSAARPNPATGVTRLAVTLAEAGDAALEVHDLAGRVVATLHRGMLPAGTREFAWSGLDRAGRAVPSGLYLVRLRAAGHEWVQRVTRVE